MIEWLTMPITQMPVWQFLLIELIVGCGLVWMAFLAGSYHEITREKQDGN